MTLKLYGLKEIPLVKKGDNIAKIIEEDLEKEDIASYLARLFFFEHPLYYISACANSSAPHLEPLRRYRPERA